MAEPAFRRVIVKVSGEALSGAGGASFDSAFLDAIAADLVASRRRGIALAVVIGGGNLVRGVSAQGVPRPVGDTMGMLATVMNGLALGVAIARAGGEARVMSALAMPQVCETFERTRALHHLDRGRILVLAGGTGNPFFTTDTAAVLRACELGCDAVLKATNVDGVYSADPKKDPGARRYERLTHDEALRQDLRVMDSTAFALARDNAMPIIVFSLREAGAIAAVLEGNGRSTVVGGRPQ